MDRIQLDRAKDALRILSSLFARPGRPRERDCWRQVSRALTWAGRAHTFLTQMDSCQGGDDEDAGRLADLLYRLLDVDDAYLGDPGEGGG